MKKKGTPYLPQDVTAPPPFVLEGTLLTQRDDLLNFKIPDSAMTPHSVDDATGALVVSAGELSFLHPEQKSPTAIRQINSNLTSLILCSFHYTTIYT